MTRANPLITSVNSGEFSTRMLARLDFERYANACKKARNVVLLPHGGFTRPPGTRYVAEIQDETKVGRVIPFRFSESQAYVIELNENIMRFYRRQAQITAANISASISNGDFTSNITGWTDQSTGSAAISHDSTNGRLTLTSAAEATAWAEQSITITETGTEHVLAFHLEGDYGATGRVRVGSTSNGDDYFTETELGLGWHVISFTPSASPAYLQFGCDMDPAEAIYVDDVAFQDNQAVELTTTYTESQLPNIRAVQTADVIYLFHPDHPTRKIERRGHKTWALVEVAWQDGPYDDANPGTDLDRVQLLENPDFEDGMSGWDGISNGTGSSEYDASQNIVVLRAGSAEGAIEQQVTTGAGGTDEYVLHYQTLGQAKADGTEIKIGTTSGGVDVFPQTANVPGWNSIAFSSSAATIYVGFRYFATTAFAGGVGAAYLYRQNANLLELSGTSGSVTCTALGNHAPFKSTDVGRIIRLVWPGKDAAWGVITAYTDTQNVTVRLRREAPYSNVPTENWRLGEWTSTNGYPAVAGFFQSRMIAANTATVPQTLWFSQSADLENMREDSFSSGVLTAEDDDALIYQIAHEQVDPIAWIKGKQKLLIGTEGGQFVAESTGASIKATDIEINQHETVFAKVVEPVTISDSLVFIESSGRQIHDIGFSFDADQFLAADITIQADHVLKSPAQELAFQRRPYSVIWARRADGRLAALSYNRRQDIIGWTQRTIGGSFSSGDAVVESICAIPGAEDDNQYMDSDERDEIWMIVKRTVNSNTVRYIEVMEGYFEGPEREDYATESAWETAVLEAQKDAFFVDSGITYSGASTTTITGLDHLEGETVVVLADGKKLASETVSSGQITIDEAATKVQVGLAAPWSFETLKLAYGAQSGTALNKVKEADQLGLQVMDAGEFTMSVVTYDDHDGDGYAGRNVQSSETIDFNHSGITSGDPIPLYTGEVIRDLDSDYSRDPRIYLNGAGPLPFTCLAIAPQMNSRET